MSILNKMSDTLKINELFFSIQGESTHAGRPCVFVRLSGCNLRCSWCDTAYAFHDGTKRSFKELREEIESYQCDLVEITGGEPLLQKNVLPFMTQLCDAGYEVLLETGGQMDIRPVDGRVQRVMDIKCPSSGESAKNHWANIDVLTVRDQVKFVIGGREDYDWAKGVIKKYKMGGKFPLLMSPVSGLTVNRELAEWILADKLDVRFQLQLHKYIWPTETRGV